MTSGQARKLGRQEPHEVNKGKCGVLQLRDQHRLGVSLQKFSSVQKDLDPGGQLNVSQQYVLVTKKSNCILGCFGNSVDSTLKEVLLPCSGEAISGMLRPIPGSLAHGRQGTSSEGPVEGHRGLGNWSFSLTIIG